MGMYITGGAEADLGLLTPGGLGKAFESLDFSKASPEMEVFIQELFRSYGQGPDIFFDLVEGLRLARLRCYPASMFAGYTRRGVGWVADLGSADRVPPRGRCCNGHPLIDGYLIMVGIVPNNLPGVQSSPCFRVRLRPSVGSLTAGPFRRQR